MYILLYIEYYLDYIAFFASFVTGKTILSEAGASKASEGTYWLFSICLFIYLKFKRAAKRPLEKKTLLTLVPVMIGAAPIMLILGKPLQFFWHWVNLFLGEHVFLTCVVLIILVFYLWSKWDSLHSGVSSVFGTARWASKEEISSYKEGFIIGWYGKSKFVRYNGEAHVITFANTGSGKGVNSIITNLLDYEGSVLCIDPKGENAVITARRRKELGQKVYTFDPWALTGLPTASFNPLDWLQSDSPDLIDDARMLATTIVTDSGRENDPHWNEEARELLAGLMVYVASNGEGEQRTLNTVRRYLNMKKEDISGLLTHMSKSGNNYVASVANRMSGKTEKEFSSVMATLQRHTHFLDSPGIQKSLQSSEFNLLDLKRELTTVYLVLPSDKLEANARWLRLFVGMAITAMARDRSRLAKPVLFLLDEFAALGRLDAISTAAGLMRGYGVKLWPILQDISQLQTIYPDKWRSIIANAGCIQAFGIHDKSTAEYISSMLGQQTVKVTSKTVTTSSGSLNTQKGTTEGETGRPLLMPDELTKLPRYQQVVLMHGRNPMLLSLMRYYTEPFFAGKYDKNPYY